MMNIAASNNPFGENIDLRQKAEDYLKQAEQRIQVQIYQKFRIDFFSQLIKELEQLYGQIVLYFKDEEMKVLEMIFKLFF